MERTPPSDVSGAREMFERAEMRWMSSEDSDITVKARDLAITGRRLAELSEAMRDAWAQITAESDFTPAERLMMVRGALATAVLGPTELPYG